MTAIESVFYFRRPVLVLLLILLALEPARADDISVTVMDEMGYGVVSKIRHLKFKADDMCDEKFRQVGEVDKGGGPIRIIRDCDDSDWLVACPVGSVYRRTAESEPKHCRGIEVAFVFGFAEVLSISFDFDSTVISPNQMTTLREYADIIRRLPNQTVFVGGHTDGIGNPEYNFELSVKRAKAVRSALVAAGIRDGQIAVLGYGESWPEWNRQTTISLEPIQ